VLKELIAIPSKMGRVLSQVERGDLTVQIPTVSRQIDHLERSVNRMSGSILFATFLVGGEMFYGNGKVLPAYILFGCSGLTLIWILFFIRGSSRRFHPY